MTLTWLGEYESIEALPGATVTGPETGLPMSAVVVALYDGMSKTPLVLAREGERVIRVPRAERAQVVSKEAQYAGATGIGASVVSVLSEDAWWLVIGVLLILGALLLFAYGSHIRKHGLAASRDE